MPELPEVETTRRGIEPHCLDRRIVRTIVHDPRLRWPVRGDLAEWLQDRQIMRIDRRSKYLLVEFENGERLLIHLGMSGSLRLVEPGTPKRTHDHIEIEFDSGRILRFHDPRRFGALLADHIDNPHIRLTSLGPEPLGPEFTTAHLHGKIAHRKSAIKILLMNAEIVVGVGNIYANEALFLAGIHPETPGCACSLDDTERLIAVIRDVLTRAIEQGGTTLRDFVREDGQPGYFKQTLNVYDRVGQACRICSTPIRKTTQSQRATYFCPVCQPANNRAESEVRT